MPASCTLVSYSSAPAYSLHIAACTLHPYGEAGRGHFLLSRKMRSSDVSVGQPSDTDVSVGQPSDTDVSVGQPRDTDGSVGQPRDTDVTVGQPRDTGTLHSARQGT